MGLNCLLILIVVFLLSCSSNQIDYYESLDDYKNDRLDLDLEFMPEDSSNIKVISNVDPSFVIFQAYTKDTSPFADYNLIQEDRQLLERIERMFKIKFDDTEQLEVYKFKNDEIVFDRANNKFWYYGYDG